MVFTNKHTQGKWEIKSDVRTPGGVVIHNGEKHIAHLPYGYVVPIDKTQKSFIEHEADAKLISQAPALRQCVEMFYDYLNRDEVARHSVVMDVVKETLTKTGVEIDGNQKKIQGDTER